MSIFIYALIITISLVAIIVIIAHEEKYFMYLILISPIIILIAATDFETKIKSKKPVIPDTTITINNGKADTLYTYKVKNKDHN